MRRLTQITVDGFRIFRERLTADLDANVVLVHGSNGCGKTSLLHAIQFAFTGAVSDLDGFPTATLDVCATATQRDLPELRYNSSWTEPPREMRLLPL